MTSVEYDLDSSGGLMSKIQALIAPPESDDATRNKKKEGLDLHPYFKRPGKGHNRDCCDSCGEGGNLICCDKCPASFHLTCHDPPLEDSDIPLGQWLCHSCRIAAGLPSLSQMRMEKLREEQATDNSLSSKEGSSTETVTRGRTRLSSTTSNDSSSHKFRGKSKAPVIADKTTVGTREGGDAGAAEGVGSAAKDCKPSPMDLLVAAASTINPRQFELPREMLVPIIFPGTDKVGPAKQGNRRGPTAKKKQPYELDNNGLVPLPAKLCYECRQTCRKAPLVSCDYCPLFFHQDCVDPPLTAMPTGRWMCPNHHQQVLEEKVLTSVSVTERVRLWDSYSGPVDPEAVKMEFFRKVRRRHPPFRFKVRLGPRARVRVPSAVREQYRVRPQMTPSLRDVLRQQQLVSPLAEASTEEEQEVWLSSVVALQTSIACHLAAKRKRKQDEDAVRVKEETISDDESGAFNGDLKRKDVDAEEERSKKLVNGEGSPVAKVPKLGDSATPLRIDVQTPPRFGTTCSTKEKLLCSDPEALASQLECSIIDTASEDTLNELDSRLVRLLALQRLQQLSSVSPKMEPSPSSPSGMCVAGLRPRALLTPLSSSGSQPPVPIFYRVVEIGSGVNMDVCLSQYGHCNFITSKHAVIICDEVNKHYELMNYSEHGTTVDNVLYSCDFSEKSAVPAGNVLGGGGGGAGTGRQRRGLSESPSQSPNAEQEIPPLIQRVRDVVGKRRGLQTTVDQPPETVRGTMPASIGKATVRCGCRSSSSSCIGGSGLGQGPGWEGTAILNHGSLIKFGCIQFTFSITECAPALPPPTNHYAPLASSRLTERELKEDNDSMSSVSNSSTATKNADAPVSPPPPPPPLSDAMVLESPPKSPKRPPVEEADDDAAEDTDVEEVSLPLYTHPKLVAGGEG